MANLDKKSVLKVREALSALGHPEPVIELTDTARSAEDAAAALGVPVGAIVKTLIFHIVEGEVITPIIALVAGDRQCKTEQLPTVLGLSGTVQRPDAKQVKALTGYSIGGVSPIALPPELAMLIDASLSRFDKIWSAAGHTHCVFPATYEQLIQMTNAEPSTAIT